MPTLYATTTTGTYTPYTTTTTGTYTPNADWVDATRYWNDAYCVNDAYVRLSDFKRLFNEYAMSFVKALKEAEILSRDVKEDDLLELL